MTQRRKTILAFVIGVLISGAGWLLVVNEGSPALDHVRLLGLIMGILFIPGLIVGLVVGANVHDPNLPAAAIANALLYGFILRLLFRRFWKGSLSHGTEE